MHNADEKWQELVEAPDEEFGEQLWSEVNSWASSWDLGTHGNSQSFSVVRVYNKKKGTVQEFTAPDDKALNHLFNRFDGKDHIEITVYNQANMWMTYELSEV